MVVRAPPRASQDGGENQPREYCRATEGPVRRILCQESEYLTVRRVPTLGGSLLSQLRAATLRFDVVEIGLGRVMGR
jgi:hypothetical protein